MVLANEIINPLEHHSTGSNIRLIQCSTLESQSAGYLIGIDEFEA